MTKYILYTYVVGAMSLLLSTRVESRQPYYPHCSPIAHEVQVAWQEGRMSRRQAADIIQRCLEAEDRGAFY